MVALINSKKGALEREQIGKLMEESQVELTPEELDEVMKDVDKDGGGDVS